jgi:hypothetical protein
MSITNATSRPSNAPRPSGADSSAATAQTPAAGASPQTPAPSTGAAAATASPQAAGVQRTDQYVRAQSPSNTSAALGPATARPSGATDLGKLVKPSESFLLRISETRGPQVASEMRALSRSISGKITDGAAVLGPTGDGVAKSVGATSDRVLQRLAEGKISPEEAKQAFNQLDLLADAVKAVKDGNLPNLQSKGVDLLDTKSKALCFDLKKGNDTYQVQVYTNPEQMFGEARVGFSITGKNGQTFPWHDQIGLRVDHQRVDGKVAVDVASTLLDQKIHGPMCDDKGVPLKGGAIPDHHFEPGFPPELNDAQKFAGFVQDFRNRALDPKEAQLPPQGIAYQTDPKASLEAITKFKGASVATELGALKDSVGALTRDGATILGPAGDGAAKAIDQTANRILGRVASGSLSPEDAKAAFAETKVLASVLQNVKNGNMPGFAQGGVNLADPTLKGYTFNMNVDGNSYKVKVTTRAQESDGEARVGFEITEKNGQKLDRREQLGLRIDHQKVDGKVAVDVDSPLLNMQVHGAMDPSQTSGGRQGIPDHHFGGVMPESLNDRDTFAKFVNDFRDAHMKTT